MILGAVRSVARAGRENRPKSPEGPPAGQARCNRLPCWKLRPFSPDSAGLFSPSAVGVKPIRMAYLAAGRFLGAGAGFSVVGLAGRRPCSRRAYLTEGFCVGILDGVMFSGRSLLVGWNGFARAERRTNAAESGLKRMLDMGLGSLDNPLPWIPAALAPGEGSGAIAFLTGFYLYLLIVAMRSDLGGCP